MKDFKLIKAHRNYEMFQGFICSQRTTQSQIYTLEHLTEVSENEIIFTASVKINAKSKGGQKLLKAMLEKQSSPIKTILQQSDKEHSIDVREDRAAERYDLPDEIKALL